MLKQWDKCCYTQRDNGEIVIDRLLSREAFPHDVSNLQLIETHISWVILTGPFAYKIKKPVKFDFVDYSSQQSRKDFCKKEFELNGRFAPDLYLDVVPIYEKNGKLMVGSDSVLNDEKNTSLKPIEYAVKMRQFSQDAILAARLERSELTPAAIEQFGKYIADFHDSIEGVDPSLKCVQVEQIEHDVKDNFAVFHNALGDNQRIRSLAKLEAWTEEQLRTCNSVFENRLNSGKVRRCHGDLHLKNVVQIDEQLIAFDGIEFNEGLQWIDVLSEIAFPVMDFVARGRTDLGWRLLNAYLESTGDYENLEALRFYLVYRALVRAKVTWLNPQNHTDSIRQKYSRDAAGPDEFAGPWDKYLKAALYFAFELKPNLSITHGFSGSGKSTVAMKLIEREGGIRIRSDVERHRFARLSPTEDKYSREMNDKVYDRLLKLAESTIKVGLPVVIDATFLKINRRLPFEKLANRLQVDFRIIACEASYDDLCQRINERRADPSEANLDVLNEQMATHDPLTTEELQYVNAG